MRNTQISRKHRIEIGGFRIVNSIFASRQYQFKHMALLQRPNNASYLHALFIRRANFTNILELIANVAEKGGFEPPKDYSPLPDFESGAFSLSATSPK